MKRAKQFCQEGLSFSIKKDHAKMSFSLGEGSSELALYQCDALAVSSSSFRWSWS
jgi:hypothetical protein